MKKIITPLILAGGTGSRLWPISRVDEPKQIIKFYNKKSMLLNTIRRIDCINLLDEPVIVCNYEHKEVIFSQLKTVNKENNLIIVEPVSKNTAPSIIAAILKITKREKKECFFLIIPSDHHIDNFFILKNKIQKSIKYILEGYTVLYGIRPNYSETGYGYIKKKINHTNCSPFLIEKFIEKPSLSNANKYVKSDKYFWNTGIYMFKGSDVIRNMFFLNPEILKFCELSVNNGILKNNFFYLDKRMFNLCPRQSIDSSIIEKNIKNVFFPLEINWLDMGSWTSMKTISKKCKSGNVIKGNVIFYDVKNSFIYSKKKLMSVIGLKNYLIIETSDSILVSPLNKLQYVKNIFSNLRKRNKKEIFSKKNKKISWGKYKKTFESLKTDVNILILKYKKKFCVQRYFDTGGKWIVIDGEISIKQGFSKLNCIFRNEDIINVISKVKFIFINVRKKNKTKLVEIKKTNN